MISISCRSLSTISKFIEPSKLLGVGTEIKIMSEKFTVSSNEFVHNSVFVSKILTLNLFF